MKALIFHADRFGFELEGEDKSSCSSGIDVRECLAVLFHVEEGDGPSQAKRLHQDIVKIARKLGAVRLVVTAFGHLSHNYAPWDEAKEIVAGVVDACRAEGIYEVSTTPFGVEGKTLILHAKSHRDEVKWRSY